MHTNTSRGLARWLWRWISYLKCWLPLKLLEVDRSKGWMRNLAHYFPWICAPPFAFLLSVILSKVHCVYFHDKGITPSPLQIEKSLKKNDNFFLSFVNNE